MYAYCSNNPVNEVDYSGTASKSLKEIWEDIRNAGKTAYDWINTGADFFAVSIELLKTVKVTRRDLWLGV